jgi:hypothetical protein
VVVPAGVFADTESEMTMGDEAATTTTTAAVVVVGETGEGSTASLLRMGATEVVAGVVEMMTVVVGASNKAVVRERGAAAVDVVARAGDTGYSDEAT